MPPKLSLVQFNRTIALTKHFLASMGKNVNDLKGLLPMQSKPQATYLDSSIKAELKDFETFILPYLSSETLCEGLTEEILQETVSNVRDLFNNLLFLVAAYTVSTNPLASSTVIDSQTSMSVANSSVILPKIKINKFSGSYVDFQPFLARFESLVDSSPHLSVSQKFEFLLSHLEGSALNVVKHLPFTEENYISALNLLKERYLNTRRAVSIHANAILDLQSLADNVDSIRSFLDQHQVNFSSLENFVKNQPDTHVQDLIYVQFILSKFPWSVRDLFEKSVTSIDFPTIKDVIHFLQRHVRALENASLGASIPSKVPCTSHSPNSKGSHKNKSLFSKSSSSSLTSTVVKNCSVCSSGEHDIFSCNQFSMLNPRERFKVVKSKALCVRCLYPVHKGKKCDSANPCDLCSSDGHNSLLHFPNDSPPTANLTCLSVGRIAQRSGVLLPTALVRLQVSPTQYIIARALLDSCAHACFVTENLVQKLNCRRFHGDACVGGIGMSSATARGQCMLSVCDLKGKVVVPNCPFHILSDITIDNPTFHIPPHVVKKANRYILADPTFHIPSRVDILLSADVLATSLLGLGQVVPLGKGLPIVVLTSFGSVIMGKSPKSSSVTSQNGVLAAPLDASAVALVSSPDDRLCDSVQRFWSLEDVPSVSKMSIEESECEKYFNDTIQRLDSGRYQVRLPFMKDGRQLLGNSYDNAFSRLRSLERRFRLDPGFKNLYTQFMADYESKGHMKLITDPSLPKYFIPHHGVYKTHGDTSKIRVVFDASSKTSTSCSLNSVLLSAPNVLSLLSDILTLFRLCKFVFSCDVEQMYRQIMIHPEDIPYQCILWRDNEVSEIKCYALLTVTYGVGPSAYLAISTLLRLARDEAARFPRASRALSRNTFVDDIHGGDNCLPTALRLRDELILLLSSGGFHLKKWASNSPELLNGIPVDDQLPSGAMRVLGLVWNPVSDTLGFPIDEMVINDDKPITKRLVLAQTAKLYDPSGYASPVIMFAKSFFQRLWRLSLDWDSPIPFELQKEWSGFKRSLSSFRGFVVPRHLVSYGKTQIHGFCDASLTGYSAVLYLRCLHGISVRVNLICSKTRVSPLRSCSIPRLELLGAHLLAKLAKHYVPLIAADVVLDDVFLWTDSSIVLSWIKIEPYLLKTFVANRVADIANWTPAFQWRHVPGFSNPADIASRGITSISDLTPLWLFGPPFLKNSPDSWPVLNQVSHSDKDLELKVPVITALAASAPESDLFFRISSWSKVLRVASVVARWIFMIKDPSKSSVAIREYALLLVVKHIQRQAFSDDVRVLEKGLLPRSNILKLSPFLDNQNVLRIKGRLSNVSILSRPCPILLPKNHRIVDLLVRHYHECLGHAGPSQTRFQLSLNYWILSARQVVRKVIHRCVRCFRAAPRPICPLMADLPAVRVNPSPPFWYSGMDYCGPFFVKPYPLRKATLVKVYLCIFICMSTKAVHLEVAHDLSTIAFIDVLKRFVSRRGVPSRLYSDCGTNFVGARAHLNKELRLLLSSHFNDDSVREFWLSNKIEFFTITPSAPHQGGLWERAVGSAKFHLKRVMGSSILLLSSFITLSTQIEGILNSRPLTPLSSEPEDYSALTPAHFLIGRPLTSLPEENVTECLDGSLRHHQLITAMVQRFWKQWRLEYLTTLQARAKWTKKTANLEVNDVVILNEPHCPPLMWPLGKIVQIFPGKDGVVRRVMVSTKNGLYERPAIKVFRLPLKN